MLLAADGKLVSKLVEEAEEARAMGLGADVEAELAGAVVEQLSEDEDEGDHDRMYRDQQMNDEKEDLRRIQKALATGKMGLLRAKARRGAGEGVASFARDAAQVDDVEEAEEQEGLDNDEAALEAREMQRQRAAGVYAKGTGFIAGEGDDDDEEGEAADAARLAKELASRDAAALAEEDSEDDDGEFDFETAMRKKAAAEARTERERRARALVARQAEQEESLATGSHAEPKDTAQAPAPVDPVEAEKKAHMHRLASIFKDADSDSEEEETAGHTGLPAPSIGNAARRGPSLFINAPPVSAFSAPSSGITPRTARPMFGPPPAKVDSGHAQGRAGSIARAMVPSAIPALAAHSTGGDLGGDLGGMLGLAQDARLMPQAGQPARVAFFGAPSKGSSGHLQASKGAVPMSAPPAQVAFPGFPGMNSTGASTLGVPLNKGGPTSFGAFARPSNNSTLVQGARQENALLGNVRTKAFPAGAATGAGSAWPLARQTSMPGFPSSESSLMGGAFSMAGSLTGGALQSLHGAASFSAMGASAAASAFNGTGMGASAGGRLAVQVSKRSGLVVSKRDNKHQATGDDASRPGVAAPEIALGKRPSGGSVAPLLASAGAFPTTSLLQALDGPAAKRARAGALAQASLAK